MSLEGPWDSPHPVFSPHGLLLLQREPVLTTAPNHQQLSLDTEGGGSKLPAGLPLLPQPQSGRGSCRAGWTAPKSVSQPYLLRSASLSFQDSLLNPTCTQGGMEDGSCWASGHFLPESDLSCHRSISRILPFQALYGTAFPNSVCPGLQLSLQGPSSLGISLQILEQLINTVI